MLQFRKPIVSNMCNNCNGLGPSSMYESSSEFHYCIHLSIQLMHRQIHARKMIPNSISAFLSCAHIFPKIKIHTELTDDYETTQVFRRVNIRSRLWISITISSWMLFFSIRLRRSQLWAVNNRMQNCEYHCSHIHLNRQASQPSLFVIIFFAACVLLFFHFYSSFVIIIDDFVTCIAFYNSSQ